jgi:thioredoxin-like negative regulator of GroEL
MDDFAARREWTGKFGAVTLDSALGAAKVITHANAPYRDLRALLETAGGILATAPQARYFSFHSGRGLDIVVTLVQGRPVATWGGQGPAITALSDDETRVLAEDAALRDAAGTIETQGIEAAFPAIERAVAAAPRRRELIPFAKRLVQARKYSIAGKIVDARLTADPDDVEAMLLDAQMIMNLVNGRQYGPEHLAEADRRLTRVLALTPDDVRARLMWCDVPRFGGDAATSAQRFRELLARHPNVDAAHYNLAAIHLAGGEPARALEHFVAGGRLAPTDADYPLGEARALLALGRKAEARGAFDRGEKLAPNHRLIATLRTQVS